VVQCTPSVASPYGVRVTGTDSEGVHAESPVVTVMVNPTLAVNLALSSATVTRGASLGITLEVTGGTAPYTYTYSGLPSGCAGSDSSSLSCAPNATGAFTVSVSVTDAVGGKAIGSALLTVQSPSSGAAPLSTLAYVGIGVVVIAAVAAVLLLAMRRRSPPSSEEWNEPTALEAETPDGSATVGESLDEAPF
jgi:hypothetical protein